MITITSTLHQLFPNSEMYLIPLSKGQPHRQSRIDPHRCTIPDVEITTAEIARDSSGLFFSEVAWSFVRTESRSGCTGEGAVVVVVVLLREVGLDVGKPDGCGEAGHGWG
jgi:hypothetical protein